jgi:hypothetical protein
MLYYQIFMRQKFGFKLKSITLRLHIKKARKSLQPISC